jgi:TonB family protein
MGTALVLSLLVHGVLGAWLMRRVDATHAAQLARLAQGPFEVVYLTQPANQIRPTRATKLGKTDNATSQEHVARARRRTSPTPAVAGAPGVRLGAPKTATPRRAASGGVMEQRKRSQVPATALIRRLPGGRAAPSLPEDYFPHYKHGGHTYINVLRYPGIDYFVEVKQSVSTAWNPVPVLREHMQFVTRQRAISTVLGIVITDAGKLEEAFVLKSSGLKPFDREALRAFRSTFPFFAPPKQLLALDGIADNRLRMSVSFRVYL